MTPHPETKRPFHPAKWLRLFITAGLMLAVDQISKGWVIATLPLGLSSQPIPALAPFFQLTHARNTGAAFGMLSGAGEIFLIIAVIVSIGLIVFYPRVRPQAVAVQIALGLVIAGALGNAIDRLHYDAVIDFIHYTIPGLISNVSNLADHAIVGGVIALLLLTWRDEDRDQQKSAEPNP